MPELFILNNSFFTLLKKFSVAGIPLGGLRFRLDIRYIAKIGGSFILEMPFSSYPSAELLKVTSEIKFINRFLHKGKI